MVEVISRKEAQDKGLTKFFTGLLCSKGHLSERYVVSRMCIACAAKHNTSEEQRKRTSEYRKNNKEKTRNYRELRKEHHKQWLSGNKDRTSKYKKTYRTNHREKVLTSNAKRRTEKLKRSVKWDVDFTNFVAEEAFHLCKLRESITGFKWHLDHVIPLCGEKVSGLHVWNNFAVIPASENLSKKNFYTVE